MTLLEKINQLNLKPRNAPAGVKVSTFGEWLRKLRTGQDIGEIPTALLTLYCDGRINESGGLKMGFAEIFSGRKVAGQYGSQIVEFKAAKVEIASTPTQEEAKKWVRDFELPSGAPGIGVEKIPTKMEDVLEAANATNKKDFSRIVSEKIPAKKPLKLYTTTVEEISTAARSVHLQPFALNTMDDPMIRRLKSDKGVSFWVLYCAKNKYRLDMADVGCSIATEEGTFVLSDFAKK